MSYVDITMIECDVCGAHFPSERDADGDPLVYERHDEDDHGLHVCVSCLPEWEASIEASQGEDKMATMTSRDIVQKMVDNDGVACKGDTQPLSIYEYTRFGVDGVAWCIILVERDFFAMCTSSHVLKVHQLWSRQFGKQHDTGYFERRDGDQNPE